jgi:hypothetical protein
MNDKKEKNEYFEYLRQACDSPEQAYRRYTLEKYFWRNFTVNENASEEVKQAFELQKQINGYCEELVKEASISQSFINYVQATNENAVNYLKEKANQFNFLSFERSEMISFFTGQYAEKLGNASRQIKSWDNLENLMTEEKNTALPLMDNEELSSKLNGVSHSYALESIVISKAKTTENLINQLDENCASLAQVVGCAPQQIGINRYNIALDIEDNPNAGYLGSHFKDSKKLYLNSYLMHDAFAHEWLHGMDKTWASHAKSEDYFMSASSQPEITALLKAGEEANKKAINQIKSEINEKISSYIDEIVERYDRGGHIKDGAQLNEKCQKVCKDIQAGKKMNKEKIAEMILSYTKESCPPSLAPYMITELEMMQHVNTSKDFKHSVFYQYAKKMDDNLVNIAKLDGFDNYSKSVEERFARMFESYVELVLQEKGIPNHISYTKGNSYTPRLEEVQTYRDKWDNLMVKFRETLNEIYPVNPVQNNNKKEQNRIELNQDNNDNTQPTTKSSVKKVANTIGNLREKFLNNSKNAVKYK